MRGYLYWSAYNNIVETFHMDAAPGRLMNGDATSCGNALAMASRDAKATPELFLSAVRQFLSTADARTCSVTCDDPSCREYALGFEVHRSGEFLYVTRSRGDERLQPGMRIVAVGRNTIPFLLKDTAQEIFWGRDTDREDWDLALRMFNDIDVFPGDGSVERLDLRRFPADAAPKQTGTPISLREVTPGVTLLTLRRLDDADTLVAALGTGRELLSRCDSLVLDLRRCEGKADPASYLALLPYLVDADMPARELFPDERIHTIYSKANAERLLAPLLAARERMLNTNATSTAADPAVPNLSLVDELIADIRAKEAQVLEAKRAVTGLQERRAASEITEVVPSPFGSEQVAVAAGTPQRVAILLDTTTGIGAERLAAAVMGQRKVQLVGRATPGAVDYANYLSVEYPDIRARFIYPISRTEANQEGRGSARTGLPLNVHVPFSPEECTRDTTLAAALEALETSN
ncbi:MAG: hypothetical protein KHY83_08960 [Coriobacteriia bacterium]|nr:hypothetical protein [Coriobacteriia bacterium]MBS5478775.1 hypothetical protein [Coriobacteriia bacterium]